MAALARLALSESQSQAVRPRLFGEQYNFGLFQFINNIFVLVSHVFVYLNYFDSESTASMCFSNFSL